MDKQVFVTPTPLEYAAKDLEGVGRLRWYQNQCYRWVKNSTGVAMVAGRTYFHGTAFTAALGYKGEVFTFGQAGKGTGINQTAGVAMAPIPIDQYGWVLVYGVYTGAGVEGTAAVAAGVNLKGVSGQTYLVLDTAAGTAPTTGQEIIALQAQGSAGVAATNIWVNVL